MNEKQKRVLSYIYSNSGTATTHDITNSTQIDDNDKVRYALQKLEEQELVETEVVELDGFQATRATLTQAGRTQIDNRLEELEEDLDDQREVLKRLIVQLEQRNVVEWEEVIPPRLRN